MSSHLAVKSRSLSNAAKPDKSAKKKSLLVFYKKFSKKSKSKDVGARSIREVQESSNNSLKVSKRIKRNPKKMPESDVSSRSTRKTDPKRRSRTNADARHRRREERERKARTRQSQEKSNSMRSLRKSKCPKSKSCESLAVSLPPAMPRKTVMVVPQNQLEKLKERLAKPTPPVVQAKAPQEKAKGPKESETICFPKARTPAKPICRSPKSQKQLEEDDVRTVLEILEQNYEPSTKVEDNKSFNGPIFVQDVQAMRLVPCWQLPVTEEENDEMCEELEDKVIDKEMCQRMIKGAIQVANAPAAKPKLDDEGDGELEDMEKLDQGYFDFDVVVGNTLKTVLFGLDGPGQGEKANGTMQHKPVPIAFNEPRTAKFYDPSKNLAAMELKEDRWTASGVKLD